MSESYEDGVRDHRLDSAEHRLDKINGSIERFADEVSSLTSQIDRLVTTANVAADLVRSADTRRLSKWQRWGLIVGIIAAAVGTPVSVILLFYAR